MTVTKIEEMDKKRVRLYIDEQFSFVLYKGELRLYHLQEEKEISQETYDEIMQQLLPKRAKLRCMNLLKTKSYTEKQLRDKLKQGEYQEELIDAAIDYVKSYGYVDDRKYAQEFIEYNMTGKSRMRMEQDLMKKGIDRKIIRAVFDEMKEEGNVQDEMAMVLELLHRKNYHKDTASIKEKQKLSSWLYGKGFGADTIRNALLLDITPNSV